MMNRYFTKSAQHVQARNNLQHQIAAYVNNLARQILSNVEATILMQKAEKEIENLNQQFPRCQPESVSIKLDGNTGDITIFFGNFIQLTLLVEKNGMT